MGYNTVTRTLVIAGILLTIAMLIEEDEMNVETMDELQLKLDNAIEREDYETAAIIRDKLNSLQP
jgi:protein-arginine kinase activator protein McsA